MGEDAPGRRAWAADDVELRATVRREPPPSSAGVVPWRAPLVLLCSGPAVALLRGSRAPRPGAHPQERRPLVQPQPRPGARRGRGRAAPARWPRSRRPRIRWPSTWPARAPRTRRRRGGRRRWSWSGSGASAARCGRGRGGRRRSSRGRTPRATPSRLASTATSSNGSLHLRREDVYICIFSLHRKQFASRVASAVGEGAASAQC